MTFRCNVVCQPRGEETSDLWKDLGDHPFFRAPQASTSGLETDTRRVSEKNRGGLRTANFVLCKAEVFTSWAQPCFCGHLRYTRYTGSDWRSRVEKRSAEPDGSRVRVLLHVHIDITKGKLVMDERNHQAHKKKKQFLALS